jgi:hypothetical protein
MKGSYNCDRKELESGSRTGQYGCALITARPLRNEDAAAVCHIMKGVGDEAEWKRLFLEGEQADA